MNEEIVCDFINDYAKSIWEADPKMYLDNRCRYYKIVIEKLEDYIEKYNAYNYVGFDRKSVEKLLKYDKDAFRNEVSQNLSYLIEISKRSNLDYYSGMEKSRDPEKKALHKTLHEEALKEVEDYVMYLIEEAFNNQFMEESLYFFLMAEKYETKPTKALYSKYIDIYFSGTINSFIRELKINQLLKKEKRVRKPIK